jgi:hypothetical protein
MRYVTYYRAAMAAPGPKPRGERAMTPAERQARYRAAQAADGAAAVKVRYRRPADRRSRPQRWRDAVAELLELQADYQQWLDGLPESLADTSTADALRAVCDLDLSGLEVDPPRGFGRD